MQLYSVSLTKSLNHVISKIRQIGKKKSVSFFDAYPFVCHLQYNKWESCSSSAKKIHKGFVSWQNIKRMLEKWQQFGICVTQSDSLPLSCDGDSRGIWSWRLRNYTLQTYRLLCNVTEYRRFEPFFFFHFFLISRVRYFGNWNI